MASESKSGDAPTEFTDRALLTGTKNERGIPQVLFIENIDDYVAKFAVAADAVMEMLNYLLSKYKMMEASKIEERARLNVKIPDLEASLDSVRMLLAKKEAGEEATTFFNLSDQVFAKAVVPPTNRVALWLGANIMLEYPLDEAEGLLKEKLAQAELRLSQNSEDLSFLRENIITTEVNIARVYNWEVMKRRAEIKAGTAAGEGAATAVAGKA